METFIDFGGFYHSIHSEAIDSAAEMLCEDDNGNLDTKALDKFDFPAAYKAYAKKYAERLNEWLNYELEVNTQLYFIRLDSPRFYNYTTDKIEVKLTKKDAKKITKAILSGEYKEEFTEYLRERTTSCSGFISFYTFEEAMSNKEDVLVMYALDFLAGKYNEEGLQGSIHEINVFETISDQMGV